MPPKQRKLVFWVKCESCGVDTTFNDKKSHTEVCGSPTGNWNVPFVNNSKFYTKLDLENGTNTNIDTKKNCVALHPSVIQLCGFVIGEHVKIECFNNASNCIARCVWPHNNVNNISSLVLSSEDSNIFCADFKDLKVCISKFKDPISLATSINFSTDRSVDVGQLVSFLKLSKRNEIISHSNNIHVFYFGKNLILNLIAINNIKCSDVEDLRWFLCNENTKWNVQNDMKNDGEITDGFHCIGGIDNILNDLSESMNSVFENNLKSLGLKFQKTILLYGHSGSGKTTIARYVAAKSNAYVVNINTTDIYSKFYGETEAALKKLFNQAIENNPSVILIDDLDVICPRRTSSVTEQEKRITATLATLLDKIHNVDAKVFVICCSSKVDVIDPSLRRYGRIDQEIEIPIPDQSTRHKMLKSMLSSISHNLSPAEIQSISDAAHGYVVADIANLCTQASMHMLSSPTQGNTLKSDNFMWALNHISPSAMREVMVDVPNVRWSDIGGEDDLKLKLKQLVEWPLKYSDSFIRLGIKPPSGILMYGPPGCSKTMIAKAVASESHLNFLSIKGPELFSKWVGESERAVRELFRKARQVAPSIIFFDEIDALGTERSNNSSSNVQERLLAQLLTEMDGITPLGNVTIIAATNRPDKIDSALLRPGRLDRIVHVPLPNENTRKSIFELRLSKMPVDESVHVSHLVSCSEGYSGAEIIAVCHEAALKALEDNINITAVSLEHFDAAFLIIKPRTPNNLLDLYSEFDQRIS